MNLSRNPKILDIINGLGMGSIALVVVMYTIYGAEFAEKNIQFSFFNFPIFIGEILLAFNLFLFILKYFIEKIKWQNWFWLVLIYFGWLLIKAFKGYVEFGPLSFRNAALFYYPIFILFGFVFYRTSIFTQNTLKLLSAFLFLIISFQLYSGFSLVPLILISLVLLIKIKSLWFRVVGFLVAAYFFPFKDLFALSRSHLVGFGVMICILFYYFIWVRYSLNRFFQWLAVGVFIILSFFTVSKFVDKNYVRSMTSWSEFYTIYQQCLKDVETYRGINKRKSLKVELYRPNKAKVTIGGVIKDNECERRIAKMEISNSKISDLRFHAVQSTPFESKTSKVLECGDDCNSDNTTSSSADLDGDLALNTSILEYKAKKNNGANLQIAFANIVFRLLIWTDMCKEMRESERIFGISFGKPQRSASIEALRWAYDEWKNVGWITPHNSYLHFVYRGGIVGLAIIGGFFVSIFYLLRSFFKAKNTVGVLLTGILIYGLVLANFGVILELPYHAIPIWSLFGVTVAYCFSIKKKRGQCELEK